MARVSQEHLDARRKQILDASRRCFVRNGFHTTSMQDILAEANLSSGALYRYFRSKQEIIIAIAHDGISDLMGVIESSLDPDTPLPVDEVLGTLFNAIEQIDDSHDLARLVVQIWSEAVRSPEVAQQVARSIQGVLETLVPRVAMYQAHGMIASTAPASHVAHAIIGVIPGFVLQRAIFGDVDAKMFQNAYAALLAGNVPQDR